MYYNARYYDPKLGRFVTADSIVASPANPQSLNRYSYVDNNPIKYTDPTGHKKKKKGGFWGFLKKFGAIFISVAATFLGHPYVGALLASGFSTAANKGSVADFAIGLGVGIASGYVGGNFAGGFAKGIGLDMAGPVSAGLRGAASGSLGGVSSATIYGGNIGQSAWQGAAYGAGTAELFWAKNAYVTEKFLNNNVKWDGNVTSADKTKYIQSIREGGQSPIGQKMIGEYLRSGSSFTISNEPLDSSGLANAHGWSGNVSLNSNIDAYRAAGAYTNPGNQMRTMDFSNYNDARNGSRIAFGWNERSFKCNLS